MNSKLEQLKEYAKIIKDAPYALKTYLQTYDNTQKKFVPLELFPDQIQLINDYEEYNENITRKLINWGQSLLQWNDTSNETVTLRYRRCASR